MMNPDPKSVKMSCFGIVIYVNVVGLAWPETTLHCSLSVQEQSAERAILQAE